MVTLSIAATRIYRSLADYAPGSTELYAMNPFHYHQRLTVDDVVVRAYLTTSSIQAVV
jgi:hypothetical protein